MGLVDVLRCFLFDAAALASKGKAMLVVVEEWPLEPDAVGWSGTRSCCYKYSLV